MNRQTVCQINGPHLIVEALGDELVIFDRTSNKAHMLDAHAASIWRATGSGMSVDALPTSATDPDRSRALNLLAILDLERAELVVTTGLGRSVSRRGLLKTLGTSFTAPLVYSILAPTTAAAATLCNTSSGGNQLGPGRNLTGGTCGTTCVTPLGPKTCHSSASASAAADGCSCSTNNQCCSGNCAGTVCLP